MMASTPVVRALSPMMHLVEDSMDEAEYLWRRWNDELSTHARDLDGVLYWVEERLHGSLDGVRAAGDAALDSLLIPALHGPDEHRFAVAAHVLATQPSAAAFEALSRAFATSAGASAAARRAVELVQSDHLLARLERTLPRPSPAQLATLLEVHSFAGRFRAALVEEAIASGDRGAVAAALGALRYGRGAGVDVVQRALAPAEPMHAPIAMETGLVLGEPEAWAFCQWAAAQPGSAPRARLLLAMLAKVHRHGALIDALGAEETRREALFALGFAGTRQAAEAALDAMGDAAVAPLAAEAFCAITGLDLESGFVLPAPEPPHEPVPFELDDLDADLVPHPDDLLPRPDVGAVRSWWSRNERRFAPGTRYLRGEPIGVERLYRALHTEPMRRRHGLALELGVRTGGHFQLQTRAFCEDQKRALATHDPRELGEAGSALSRSFS